MFTTLFGRIRAIFAFIGRFAGLWLLAGALVTLVLDGTRSIAASSIVLTPLGETWFKLHTASLHISQAFVQRYLLPEIWDPGIQTLLLLPSWVVLGVLGLVFLIVCRKRPHRIRPA